MSGVLLAEDDDLVRGMLYEYLTSIFPHVYQAADGEEALEIVKSSAPELIISDIIMPHKDGLTLLQEARALDPEIKFIAISGGGRLGLDSYLQDAQRMGAHEVFAKPVHMPELLKVAQALAA